MRSRRSNEPGGTRGLLVALLVCAGSVVMAQGVRTIDKSAQSNVDDTLRASAKTSAEWSALWKKHNYDKPAPAVDFSKEMVVAVFMGSRPTAGFGVEIVSAEERDGKLVVSYRETTPAPGTITAQVITSPCHIAAIPKPAAATVVFEKR